MFFFRHLIAVAIFTVSMGSSLTALAQQVTIGAPMQGLNDGFFENFGIGFGARGPNWFFTNGGGGVIPPFGGFDPNAGARLGFGFGLPGGGSGFFNLTAGQGSNRSNTMTAPSVTVLNGGQGFIADVTMQPFVTGIVPVVGGFAGGPAPQFGPAGFTAIQSGPSVLEDRLNRIRESGGFQPRSGSDSGAGSGLVIANKPPAVNPAAIQLAAAQQSSAARPAASIAEIRKQQAAEDEAIAREMQSQLDRGRKAQADGNRGVARIYYAEVARRATGKLKAEAEEALRSLGDSGSKR